jgi:hypothetical protein
MNEPTRRPFPDFYRPLAHNFTRVFELDAGTLSDPIVGRLVPQAMDAQPYEAISYVWGSPLKRRDIIVDGVTVSVTENLHGALTAFRHKPEAGHNDKQGAQRPQIRRLWVDAVCINQEDLQERISQVELMSLIYAGASRVLSWLGWEQGAESRRHIQTAIRFIRSFMQDPDAGLQKARVLLLHHDYLADPIEDLAHLSDNDRRLFENQAPKWESVKFFFEIEYFHRAWIVQELGLAREALLITALKPPTDATSTGEQNITNKGATFEDDEYALEVDVIHWPLVGRFVACMDYSGASLVTHLGLLSWVAHHILMVWETKSDGTPACDFLTGMHWTRILRVTDPRDRAFSLLGHPMAKLDGELVIHPDYTCTRGVIYARLAVNFIRKTKNLYILSLVDHEEDPPLEQLTWVKQHEARMPSWVPDWHAINRTTPMDYTVDAAPTEDNDISFSGGVDCKDDTSLPILSVRGWIVDEVAAVTHRMETTDFPITHLARELKKEHPFWLDSIWEVVHPTGDHNSPHVDPLATLEFLSLALALGTREADDPVGKAGSNQTLEEHHRSFAAYVMQYHELLNAALSDDEKKDTLTLPTRSVFNSLPTTAQTELRRRAQDADAAGFLECMTWPSMCRIVYRTATGLVGMGSRVTNAGDLVCRVRGSAVLMTLRRIDELDDADGEGASTIRCAHIGPTVVPARMQQGVVEGGEFSEVAATFKIV